MSVSYECLRGETFVNLSEVRSLHEVTFIMFYCYGYVEGRLTLKVRTTRFILERLHGSEKMNIQCSG